MKSAKILFGTTEWVTANTFLLDQLNFLSRRGLEVHLACSKVPPDVAQSGVKGEVWIHPICMTRKPHLISDLAAFLKWIGILRTVWPDTFVGSTPKASLLGMVAARILGIRRRVYWIHGLRYETSSGAFRWFLRNIERLTMALATDVIVVSMSLQDVIHRDIPEFSQKVRDVGAFHANGVDFERFKPADDKKRLEARQHLELPRDSLVVGFLGRRNADKGLDFLLEAWMDVAEEIPTAILVVAGPEDSTNPVSARTLQLLEHSSVRAIATQIDAVRFFQSLDVFVMPSLREGLSTVNLEAASSGIPVLTTTATGCVDSVVPGKTGFIVPPRDVRALSETLVLLLKDGALREELGAEGRKWVKGSFGYNEVWEAHFRFFGSSNSLEGMAR